MKDWWVTRREPMRFYQARADWIGERRRRRQDRELIEKKAEEFREYQRKYGEQPKKMTMKRPSKFFLIKADAYFSDGCYECYWNGAAFVEEKSLSCIFTDRRAADISAATLEGRFTEGEVGNVRVVPVNRIATSEAERSVMWQFAPVVDLASDHLENLIRFIERGEASGLYNPEDVTRAARQELKRRGRNVP